ncbi:protein spinster homolog 2 [Hyalella azteca]|uniref:Protein spinster homolog 2 n=1 Tax=Hyalella azteca TaxID=294128 RepID=A0A8B7PLD0_HYAAZ|nr:protein spinster homolog 2 [Hyalella azteca]
MFPRPARTSKWVQLSSLSLLYVVGELAHFLLGVVTTPMSQELHYGDHGCLVNPDLDTDEDVPDNVFCYQGNSSDVCTEIWVSSTSNESACVWDYSGLGMQYQLLAGPSFVAVFTISGVFMGFVSDRVNRKNVLAACLALITLATLLMGTATQYWHLVVLRMMIGAGESSFAPSASSIISDLFTESVRGLALGIFNWGIYLGYGLSYIIGNYVTAADILGMGWRWSYYISGMLGVLVLVYMLVVLEEPPRLGGPDDDKPSPHPAPLTDTTSIDSDTSYAMSDMQLPPRSPSVKDQAAQTKRRSVRATLKAALSSDFVSAIIKPSYIFLCLAASIRHTGGFTWAYNTQLYFQTYYPHFNVGAWVSWVSIVGGTVGVAVGGFVSDRLVKKLGVKARLYVLAASQFAATPFAAGVLYLAPPAAMYSLLCAYFFAEMWFGILFAVLLDIVPGTVKASSLAFFLFVMNNIGGNAPVLVEPLRNAFSYRTALYIMYPGCFLLSSGVFLFTSLFVHDKKVHKESTSELNRQ